MEVPGRLWALASSSVNDYLWGRPEQAPALALTCCVGLGKSHRIFRLGSSSQCEGIGLEVLQGPF